MSASRSPIETFFIRLGTFVWIPLVAYALLVMAWPAAITDHVPSMLSLPLLVGTTVASGVILASYGWLRALGTAAPVFLIIGIGYAVFGATLPVLWPLYVAMDEVLVRAMIGLLTFCGGITAFRFGK